MELPDVGEHCDEVTCKQIDFLPFKCTCGQRFCSDHFKTHTDQCSTPTGTVVTEPRKIEDVHRCSFRNCKTTSIVPLICPKCEQHFCIMHRHIIDCNQKSTTDVQKPVTSAQLFKEAKLIVDKQLDATITQAKKKSKSSELANKIQLMRVKNKAKGLKSIPVDNRVYFMIQFLNGDSKCTLPLFFSKTWTVGKVVDVIAEEFKIQNKNNLNGALKLRLFKETDGSIITKDASDKLETLLGNNVIVDGETFQFSFVSDDCLCLDDINKLSDN